MTALIDLRLGSNELTGTLPTELGDLENLRDLHIQRNELSGELPLSFAGLKNLHEFHAYSNKIKGKIPMQIGFLGFFSQLKVLYLENNELSGTIPSSMANIKGLVDLYLSKNNLEGPIPKTLSQLSGLENLRLNDNQVRRLSTNSLFALVWLRLVILNLILSLPSYVLHHIPTAYWYHTS